MADALSHAGEHFSCEADLAADEWNAGLPIITAQAPVGPSKAALPTCVKVRRGWDVRAWPKATRGYFNLRSSIPQLLSVM